VVYCLTYTSTSDGNVSLDVREDDVISGVVIEAAQLGSSAGILHAELSFSSTSSINTNDTTAVLAHKSINNLTGDGAAGSQSYPCAEKISAGERLYLHVDVPAAGTSAVHVRALIFTEKGGAKTSRRLR
jgi:hypothetical protein